MTPPFKVGDVIKVSEPDYCYGLGELTLRLTALPANTHEEWIYIKGNEIYWNGVEGHERIVLVRARNVRRQPS